MRLGGIAGLMAATTAICVACGSLPARPALTAQQRADIRADSEVFEAVVAAAIAPRSKLDTTYSLARILASFHVDSSFEWKSTPFPSVAGGSNRPGPSRLESGPDSAIVAEIHSARKRILAKLGIHASGPLSFPDCPGMLAMEWPDPRRKPPNCPQASAWYTAVGFPHRGLDPVFQKFVRQKHPVIDPAVEVWTVLVTRDYVGPKGRYWHQSALVLGRNAVTGKLEELDSYLLSWVE